MKTYRYGDPDSSVVLIQPVDDHDMDVMDSEVDQITKAVGKEFLLVCVKVDSWNNDLSPWKAPAVFGNEDFGDGAEKTLAFIAGDLIPELKGEHDDRQFFIGGYSLAGLFALWSVYQTDLFSGVAAASPSVWFPGFPEYTENNPLKAGRVYLSLGDKEEKTRNHVMAAVGDNIRAYFERLKEQGRDCILEWNPGNHFRDPDKRTARAFAWLLEK